VPPRSGRHFRLLASAIQGVYAFGGRPVAVVPGILSGATDSAFYAHLSRHGVLRHIPVVSNRTAGDIQRIHGTNERVAVEDLRRCICVLRAAIEGFGMLGREEEAGEAAAAGAAASARGEAAEL
jgi:acetylornithine deacetylase/succinyl-diaminopimelate desuccinylase-like protein